MTETTTATTQPSYARVISGVAQLGWAAVLAIYANAPRHVVSGLVRLFQALYNGNVIAVGSFIATQNVRYPSRLSSDGLWGANTAQAFIAVLRAMTANQPICSFTEVSRYRFASTTEVRQRFNVLNGLAACLSAETPLPEARDFTTKAAALYNAAKRGATEAEVMANVRSYAQLASQAEPTATLIQSAPSILSSNAAMQVLQAAAATPSASPQVVPIPGLPEVTEPAPTPLEPLEPIIGRTTRLSRTQTALLISGGVVGAIGLAFGVRYLQTKQSQRRVRRVTRRRRR